MKSDDVYRKVRSEQLSKNDRSDNDLWDMIEMQRDHSEYLKSVGVLFYAYIWSAEQLFLLNNSKPILHLDATGSII